MKRALAAATLGVVFGLAGCATQHVAPLPSYESIGPSTPTGPRVATPTRVESEPGRWKTVGTSVQGRSIQAWSRGNGSQRVMYLGCIHGDEYASRQLLEKLMQDIDRHPEMLAGKRVVVVPVANPDGYAMGSRTNGHGVDLNRNFPTTNYRGGLDHGMSGSSEPETRALCRLIREEQPDVIVTLHSPLECVDYDGPAMGLANRMARRCGLPVKQLGARPGSLGSYAGLERRIATVTVELPAEKSGWAVSWEHMGPALLEAMKGGRAGGVLVETPEVDGGASWRGVRAK